MQTKVTLDARDGNLVWLTIEDNTSARELGRPATDDLGTWESN